jgi:hypothetical protein
MGCASSACIITLTSGQLPAIDDALTITGPGAANLTISGNNAHRVMQVNSGKSLALSGVTIANGRDDYDGGGGIYNNQGTLTVTNSTFSGNSAFAYLYEGGGGIYNNQGTLTVTYSTFSGNNSGRGGGIYNNEGTLTVTYSTFSGNNAEYGRGGGIYNDEGTLTVTYSTFSGNNAGRGGGIDNFAYSSGTLTVSNSTFSANSAQLWGGGIFSEYGTGTVSNSTFSANTAGNEGGGIHNNSSLIVRNSTFSANTADRGGGIYNYSPSVSLAVTNSTFSGNSAVVGGGIFHDTGTLILRNSIIANSTSGGDCSNSGTIGSNVNTLIHDGSCNTGTSLSGFLTGDPKLGPLADNGGPTQTFALLPESPAIDAGDATICALVTGVNNLDQRGATRPAGAACDRGAFEAGAQPIIVTNTADGGTGSLRAAMTFANLNPGADTITFDRTAMGCPSTPCGTIILESDLPAIDDDLTITGPGATNLTISGNDLYRVMQVNSGKTLTLSGVTIANEYEPPAGFTATVVLQPASDTGASDSDNLTSATTLVFDVTFSAAVTGLATADFSLSGTATGCKVTRVTGSGTMYAVSVSGCKEGTVVLTLTADSVVDGDSTAGPAEAVASPTVTIDRTAPGVLSFTRTGMPSTFTLTFSEDVSGLTAADFALSGKARGCTLEEAGITAVSASVYTVQVTGCTSSGTLKLTLQGRSVTDIAGNVGPPKPVAVTVTVP